MTETNSLTNAKRELLASRLRRRRVDAATIPRRPRDGAPPLSYPQERLWFMEQFAPGTAAYTIPQALRLRGPLDVAALDRALCRVADRHEALRTRFASTEDGRPVTRVEDRAGLSPRRAEADTEDAARDLVDAVIAEPFDLATGPLIRASLIRLADDDHVLALATHHIASDGWSAGLFVRETLSRYHAERAGNDGIPPEPAIDYGDFAAWQRDHADHDEDDSAYWSGRLAGIENLAMPTDRPRPAEQTHRGAAHGFRVEPDLAEAIDRLARNHGATRYMTLLAAFQALLARYSGQHDIAVGTPVAGRTRPELEEVIGCFVNMLTMRAHTAGDPTFTELLLATMDTAIDAFTHQELPFERLVKELDVARDVSRSPLFQVLFTLQNYGGRAAEHSDLDVSVFSLGSWATRFDLELYVSPDDDGLAGLFVYNTDLFDAETIRRLADHLLALVRAATARSTTRLSELDILAPGERRAVLDEFNATEVDAPEATLHGLVEEQVARTPEATAVTFEGTSLSYAELNARAERLASRLRDLGATPGVLVAVCADRSVELVVALLAVLKTGAGYVPLDPEYPVERLAFMLADCAAPILVTRRTTMAPPPTDAHVLDLDALDSGDEAAHSAVPVDGSVPVRSGDVAYVIYTSGSTGRPKGVPNTHGGIVNRLRWTQRHFGLSADDTVVQKTPAGFDVSVWEFFWPLTVGARLVVAAPGGHKDAEYLRDLIVAEGVTTAHFVPSMLAVFLADERAVECASLRRVICSGEELPVDVARRCLATLPVRLHNLYGPTEAAVDVSSWECTSEALAGRARVPIGTPVHNTGLYVLDEHLNPTPMGVPGELYIGGAQVARGYLGRPGLTARRFVPDPFGPPGARLYRTGDLVRMRPEVGLEFLGRLDTQVKVRGLRIELGEIEAALRGLPEVRDAAVIVREDRPGDRRITAYPVPAGEADLDTTALRSTLKERLPDYMVPAAFVPLPELPLSANGKLDRRALPAPAPREGTAETYRAPTTETEQAIAAIWCEVLDVERVGLDDDFFDLGGHSLLATQVVAKLRNGTGASVSVMDVFKYRTVAELASLVDTPAAERGPRELLHELTAPVPPDQRVLSYVCVPYGGGSAVVYQPLADALPPGHCLYSLAIPGHDIGLDEDVPGFDEVAARCVTEVLDKTEGPLALYGHCGVGSAMIVEVARRLEAAGRRLEVVYIGAIFPFAQPKNRVMSALARFARMEPLRADRGYQNWLTSMGVEMSDLDADQARRIVRNMRRDSDDAEEYYTELLRDGATRLRAPMITVAGDHDPTTDYYQERYREWHFLTETSGLVVLDEAGHFFLKYRAEELAEIVTTAHRALDDPGSLGRPARGADAGWWLHGVSRSSRPVATSGPQPSMRRFLAVAAGQLVSMTGSALTEFAIPLWIYLRTGSMAEFALFTVFGMVPGLLVTPLSGALVDRMNRRTLVLAGDVAAGATQLTLGVLLWTGNLRIWHIFALLVGLSVALQFQRLAYTSSVPQLVPKPYLGNANGVVQMFGGIARLMVPLFAVGLMATIGLDGILILDVVSYAFAITVTAVVRFPRTMPWHRKESIGAELLGGVRLSWGQPGFRAMLTFFMIFNVFLAPLVLLFSPLVLSFATLGDVGRVAFASAIGATTGGLTMTVWGGPQRHRMTGMLVCTFALAASCAVVGLRPELLLIAVGAFGIGMWLTIINGIYTTIVQVKVPQRFHGRVFALNTLIAWSTMPLGYGLIVPYGSELFESLLSEHGPLASTVGTVIGVGEGRGIALMYVTFALALAALAAVSLRRRALARFDAEVPDADPDDLVGKRIREERTGSPTTTSPSPLASKDRSPAL